MPPCAQVKNEQGNTSRCQQQPRQGIEDSSCLRLQRLTPSPTPNPIESQRNSAARQYRQSQKIPEQGNANEANHKETSRNDEAGNSGSHAYPVHRNARVRLIVWHVRFAKHTSSFSPPISTTP
jgi:hypothetical protein